MSLPIICINNHLYRAPQCTEEKRREDTHKHTTTSFPPHMCSLKTISLLYPHMPLFNYKVCFLSSIRLSASLSLASEVHPQSWIAKAWRVTRNTALPLTERSQASTILDNVSGICTIACVKSFINVTILNV